MKKLEFETNGQKWLVTDIEVSKGFVKIDGVLYEKVVKLSDITEKQASEVVDESIYTGLFAHYVENIPINTYCYNSAIESLHSLIESKGWHLFENPFKGEHPNDEYVAEDYTLYNPYLFRIKN